MRRIFILFWATAVMLTLAIVGTIATTDATKFHNDFIRIFPPHFVTIGSILKTEPQRFSLAGLSNKKIYLQDRSGPSDLLAIGHESGDTTRIDLHVPKGFEIAIDSPYFFLYNGYIPQIERGSLSTCLTETVTDQIPGFTLMVPISWNTAILRAVDMQKRKNVFVTSDSPNFPKDILKKQVDGILCTDGFLQYSKEYNRLVYTYRYRNQFICMDTLLNVKLSGKTIDTTSIAKISVAEIDGEIKMSKPPFVVNRSTCVSGRYLFVHSNLTARNESFDNSKMNSVIDIYDVLDGHYLYSFYLENVGGKKVQSFKVNKHMLVAVFPGYIVRYSLNSEYVPL